MKKLLTVCLLAFAAAGATGCRSAAEGVKPKLMWLDCSANWVRFSYPDSIRYYVNKCREAGMTALVLDVKGTSSEVVYPSEYAPQVREWKGFTRPDFDFVGTFVDAAHDAGLEIYGGASIPCREHSSRPAIRDDRRRSVRGGIRRCLRQKC